MARALLGLPALAKCATTSASRSARNALRGHQFGVAGPDADADQARGAHSPALASALTAAAVIALPPMRPRTMR